MNLFEKPIHAMAQMTGVLSGIAPAGREVPPEFTSAELRDIVANVGFEVGAKISAYFLVPDTAREWREP